MGRVLDRLSAGGRVFRFRDRKSERVVRYTVIIYVYMEVSIDLAARAASCPRGKCIYGGTTCEVMACAPSARRRALARCHLRGGYISKTPPARWRRSWETLRLRGGGREYELPARWFVRPLPAGRTGMSPARWHCRGRTTCAVVRLASPARRTGVSPARWHYTVGELPARWFVWPSPARRRGMSPARWHCCGRTTCAVVRLAFACAAEGDVACAVALYRGRTTCAVVRLAFACAAEGDVTCAVALLWANYTCAVVRSAFACEADGDVTCARGGTFG